MTRTLANDLSTQTKTSYALIPPRYRVALVRETCSKPLAQVHSEQDAFKIFREAFQDADREMFLVMPVDSKNKPIGINVAHVGSLTSSIVTPREIFKPAILMNASAILVAHNHPSGNPEPSPEDIEVTRRLVRVGKDLDIPVVDHVIVGEAECYSFMCHRSDVLI